ncbi:MAG: hypothetical protein AMJ56_02085 [Anaerolineae bacterium SG8_19]|nr:MAG: hypothetical protein AMJ56_02085 [Anaerolineae bacterium SG8_19]
MFSRTPDYECLAVAITVALLSGIQLAPDVDNRLITILVYLILGGLFGLKNAFIRPLVLLVTEDEPKGEFTGEIRCVQLTEPWFDKTWALNYLVSPK